MSSTGVTTSSKGVHKKISTGDNSNGDNIKCNTSKKDTLKKQSDEPIVAKMRQNLESIRADNSRLKQALDSERSAVRALKAQYDSAMRKERADAKRREEHLDKQIRIGCKSSADSPPPKTNDTLIELTKLTNQLQSSRESNRKLQDKLKEFREQERTRTTEMRAQHDTQRRLLLEELKTKDRLLMQLKKQKQHGDGRGSGRALAPGRDSPQEKGPPDDAIQMTERLSAEVARLEEELRCRDDLIRTLRQRKMIEKNNNTEETPRAEIRHRKETSYRENFVSDADSAISSAPSSLSPQPSNEVWGTGAGGCGACRAASARAAAAAREAARLTDQLRDARDQLELLEFRLLELDDCAAEKCLRENLTDSDSGCVSPGSRMKDSASPIFRRTDSGYKSPTTLSPTSSSPFSARRLLETPTRTKTPSDFDNMTDSVLSDSVFSDRNLSDSVSSERNLSDSISLDKNLSDSMNSVKNRSNLTKEHLETMIVNAVSMEDRNCLEQVMLLLCNLQALNNSMSEDEFLPLKPKPICDLKATRNDVEQIAIKAQKIIATVSPYSQNSFTRRATKSIDTDEIDSLEKYFNEDGKKIVNVLQESGIFEDVETDEKQTQTELSSGEGNSLIDGSGDLNTEIQRLNSIREQLERKSVVRNRSIKSQSRASPQFDDFESLECRCVKLGMKHKQYYERRLKFLEGKISIYESAQDVKEAKLAQRLQTEFILQTKIEELESDVDKLRERCSQLEEDCCELEESENDTRLHCQQLEIEYSVVDGQLRDMARAAEGADGGDEGARRALRQLERRNHELQLREQLLREKLYALEQATPISVFWHVYNIVNDPNTVTKTSKSSKKYKRKFGQTSSDKETQCQALVKWRGTADLASKFKDSVHRLEKEKTGDEVELNQRLSDLEVRIAEGDAERRNREQHIQTLEIQLETSKNMLQCYQSMEPSASSAGAQSQSERELRARVSELERRELAYLEMLTQADDMWADMEGGYKRRIRDVEAQELALREQLRESESERNKWKCSLRPLRAQLRELEESESAWRADGERAAREARELSARNERLAARAHGAEAQLALSQQDLRDLHHKYKTETEANRQRACRICEEINTQKMIYLENEETYRKEMERLKKDLANSCKTILDMEVTNGELKEEVESLEGQLLLAQEQMSQCKQEYEDNIKSLSGELADKNKEMEVLRCEAMNFKNMPSALDELQQVRNSYEDEYMLTTAVPKFFDTRETDCNDNVWEEIETDRKTLCPCNHMRKQLIGILIEDLFSRVHNGVDDTARVLSNRILQSSGETEMDKSIERDIEGYLLESIVRDLKRSVGDAEEKIQSDAWSEMVRDVSWWREAEMEGGDVGVSVCAAARLASVSCACAAATVCAAVQARLQPATEEHPATQARAYELRQQIKRYQEVVLTNDKVQVTQNEVSAALRNLVNCSMCSSHANTHSSVLWSTDV